MPTRRRRTTAPRPRRVARTLDARPDTVDFRDQMFEPTLVEVPVRRTIAEYRAHGIPILDQGREGACTGFGLATVVHYLLRTRRVVPDATSVSPRMLYDMARRYDEWPGEHYEGSSARGAMKGWHKHGICSTAHWRYKGTQDPSLFEQRFTDALHRPLGAYFRVNHKDLVAMHAAIAEVGILYATAQVHEGWSRVGASGLVDWTPATPITGGHAFAIVAFDERGFWVQNSWGPDWGFHGHCQITYDDWLANGSDVWVARLGAPFELRVRESVSTGANVASQGTRGYVFSELRPHIISLGNNGALRESGTYGTSRADVAEIFAQAGRHPAGRQRLLIYAHGGLVAEDSAIQKVAELRAPLLEAGVYPISIIWKTDFWTTVTNILHDAIGKRRPEGMLDAAKDFMLDRLDDALEPIARTIGGRQLWGEMKENAARAAGAGLVPVLDELTALKTANPRLEIHLVAHSAGSILLGGLIAAIMSARGRRKLPITSCTLLAPACTMDVYTRQYLPAIRSGQVERFSLFTLTDRAEQDDHCAHVYHRSLLYLVSNAFEQQARQPGFGDRDGTPILGMEHFVRKLPAADRPSDWVLSPNTQPVGSRGAARATSHGDLDDDPAILKATLARILGVTKMAGANLAHRRSASSNQARRNALTRRG